LVGRNMAGKPGICGSIFSILGDNSINAKLIAQSIDEITIIIGVTEVSFKKAIGCLYDGLHSNNLI
ncbi:MAG: aspartate kinase, partial [Clostridia bacterium]|nr:aspartate kinase [Clostridia bacterium]